MKTEITGIAEIPEITEITESEIAIEECCAPGQ